MPTAGCWAYQEFQMDHISVVKSVRETLIYADVTYSITSDI